MLATSINQNSQNSADVPSLGFTALTLIEARSPIAKREGYAFETAMCQIESQSPFMRPVTEGSNARSSTAATSEREHALLTRILLLTNFIEGARDRFDNKDMLVLEQTASQITRELLEAIGSRTTSLT